MAKKNWGFDTRDMDKGVRPQDDFFHHANGGWLKKSSIPSDESRWGTFLILRKDTETKVRAIVDDLLKHKSLASGSEEQQIRDLYRSAMDMKRRNRLDKAPLTPFIKKVEAIKTHADLMKCITELHLYGVGVLWGTAIDQDEKNSAMNILHVFQGGLGLPERDYYLGDKPEQVRVRTAYQAHVERMFTLLGIEKGVAAKKAAVVMAIETRLAKASMKKEDIRNPDKTYHKMPLAALQKSTKNIGWKKYLSDLGIRPPTSLNVMQPDFLKVVSGLLTSVPVGEWQTYFTWHLVSDSAGHLGERFVQANFDFYATVLTGTKEMKPLWRRSLAVVSGSLGEALGKLYVKKHFPPEAKRLMDELITDLFSAYEERIKKLDWMSPATKKQALTKLRMMDRKIGYPKKWKSYKGLVIKPDDHFGNVLRSSVYEHKRVAKRLGKPVDRGLWYMTPQTVNAYYNPGTNEIAFPAAILQPPYFGPNQDAGVNYGAIGAVIGHEITHGFDNEGSKFDGHGNLRKWWTPADRKRFEAKARVVQKQFDAYELHGVKVNGKLTLGENIADLGGDAIALDAYYRHLAKHPKENVVIDGFTPTQRFFLSIAQEWRELSRPEVQKTQMLTDPHSPDIFRTNGPASNLPEFYEAFGVKKGDKLYRDPKQRAKIW